jgi:hypothetical protein
MHLFRVIKVLRTLLRAEGINTDTLVIDYEIETIQTYLTNIHTDIRIIEGDLISTNHLVNTITLQTVYNHSSSPQITGELAVGTINTNLILIKNAPFNAYLNTDSLSYDNSFLLPNNQLSAGNNNYLKITNSGTGETSWGPIQQANLSQSGIVMLDNTVDSTSIYTCPSSYALDLVNNVATFGSIVASQALSRSGGTMNGSIVFYSCQPLASTTSSGITQLNNTTSSTSVVQAATANSVKNVYDLANTAYSIGLSGIPQSMNVTVTGSLHRFQTKNGFTMSQWSNLL